MRLHTIKYAGYQLKSQPMHDSFSNGYKNLNELYVVRPGAHVRSFSNVLKHVQETPTVEADATQYTLSKRGWLRAKDESKYLSWGVADSQSAAPRRSALRCEQPWN